MKASYWSYNHESHSHFNTRKIKIKLAYWDVFHGFFSGLRVLDSGAIHGRLYTVPIFASF